MAEILAQRLRRQIVRGELVEGDALPPESVLVERFGVSRPTLREALRVLEAERLVSIRRGTGGGARIHAPDPDVAARYAGFVLEFQGATLADVHEVRTVLEIPCAGLLARNRTDEDLAALWKSVRECESIGADHPLSIRQHAQFHALVVDLTGSLTLGLLSRMLRQIIELSNWHHVDSADPADTAEAVHHATRSHRRLVELIEDRDAEGATRIWTKHLIEADNFVSASTNGKRLLDLLD